MLTRFDRRPTAAHARAIDVNARIGASALAHSDASRPVPAALTTSIAALPPLDWGRVFTSNATARVLCLGEDHTHPEIRDALCDAMSAAKQAGFTHVALEMFYSDQGLLDGGKQPWCATVSADRFHPQSYVDLVVAVRAAGLVAVGIDKRFSPNTRDAWMRARVHEIVDDDPNARVLVLVGHMHLEHQEAMSPGQGPNLFEREGLAVTSLRFLTGGLVVDDAIAKAGRAGDDVFIPVDSDRYAGVIALAR